ncbi:MAG TPA: FecR domain-containing protein [Verrucomicrobiae bacterium]|jgi:hypothetical protein|nr:FecR domain-containing protein [Verrucomicrobiae bacterium]
MKKLFVITTTGVLTGLSSFGAIDLKESKFTQVVNDVEIISTSDNSKHAASVDGLFKMPDVLRTGPGSRAELVAADNTITRVGANTIFSFDAANRSIHLEQGSLLFNSPKGKGGGSIHTAAATAAVLGTTIIVVTTPSGGFKVLTLEGTAEVKFQQGFTRQIHAGQLIFVLPGGLPGPVLSFRLDQQVTGSRLVQGFNKPLGSINKVNAQIAHQIKQIASGKATDTGLLVGSEASSTGVQVISAIAALNGGDPENTGSNPLLTPMSGGSTNSNNGLPPGYVVPNGLTFRNGGFVQPDNFVFISQEGQPITDAALPAEATVGAANDVTISSSTLDSTRVFTEPVTVEVPEFSSTPFHTVTGFIARNITFSTPSVDLSPYSSLSRFTFLATEGLAISGSLDTGSSDAFSGDINFAGATLTIASGSKITSESDLIDFGTINALNLNQVSFANSGEVELSSSDSDVTLTDSPINASQVEIDSGGILTLTGETPTTGQITTGGNIILNSESGMTINENLSSDSGDISLANTAGTLAINSGVSISTSGDISIDSDIGAINVAGANIQGRDVGLTSGNGMTLNGATIGADTEDGELDIFNDSFNPLTVNNGTILSASVIDVESDGPISFDSSTIGDPMQGAMNITVEGDSSISLNSTPVTGNNILISANDTLTLSQSVNAPGTITGGASVDLESGDGMSVGVNIVANGGTGRLTIDNSFDELHILGGVQMAAGLIQINSEEGSILIDPGVTINGSGGIGFQADSDITIGANVASTGGNINVETFEGNLDLSPGASLSGGNVALIADDGSILIDGTSTIVGNSSVSLHSSDAMSIGGNITSAPSGGNISLISDNGPITINAGVQISGDNIGITSGGFLQTASSTVLSGNSSVQLSSIGGANIGGTITANAQSGSISVANSSGQLTINNGAKFTASVITFNSPDGILIDTPGQIAAGTLNISSGTQLSAMAQVQNADLSGVGSLNVNARTIVLTDVALPNSGNTSFGVANGVTAQGANTMKQIILGDVNLVKGVTFQGTLITDAMIQQGAAGYTVHGL